MRLTAAVIIESAEEADEAEKRETSRVVPALAAAIDFSVPSILTVVIESLPPYVRVTTFKVSSSKRCRSKIKLSIINFSPFLEIAVCSLRIAI